MRGRPKLGVRHSPERQRQAVIIFILFMLAVLPYANTLLGNFVYDDNFQVVENPYVHSFRYLPQIFGTTVWSFQGAQGVTNYYRPLMTFGYLLTYQIAGDVPFSFHLVNLLLHALVVLLVFYLLRRWSGERVALLAAGLFALHPVHTESVAWIAGVTDLELSVFYLLTFLLYLRLAQPNRGMGLRLAMCASLAMAFLSKEQAMTLPVLATLFEHFYREDRSATSPRQKFSRYGPLWVIAAVYLVVRITLLGGLASIVSRPGLSFPEVILSAISLTGEYLWKLIWPLNLSSFYVFHKSSHITDPAVLFGLLALALCAAVFLELWFRKRLLSFGLVWLFLTLGPVLNARWMPAGVFAERYLYLPSVGFCWIFAWAAVALWQANISPFLRPLSRLVPYLLAGIALLCGMKTVARNRDWRSEQTLFQRTLATQADASMIRSNLGAIYFNRGETAKAEHEWLQALAAGPNDVFALNNLGLLRERQYRYSESLDYFARALRARPAYTVAHLNLAETFAAMGRAAEADWQYRIATALSPLSTRAHNSYGNFLIQQGRTNDALTEFERSVRVDPTAEALSRLGEIYLERKDYARAELAFRRAIGINPFDSKAHFGLGKTLQAGGRPSEALHEFEQGLETDPSDTDAKAAINRLRASQAPASQPTNRTIQ